LLYFLIHRFQSFQNANIQQKTGLVKSKNKFLFLNVSTGEYEGNVTVNL